MISMGESSHKSTISTIRQKSTSQPLYFKLGRGSDDSGIGSKARIGLGDAGTFPAVLTIHKKTHGFKRFIYYIYGFWPKFASQGRGITYRHLITVKTKRLSS
ncbi:hypothetical protein NDU88_006509 [Pleurodeles waltl]|uniref:Uncharacterized protein n=1 Tax=Pleurodeles waltl TaxID=8319 RepID=A0AAV7SPQ0_PLEWA|nr:hypothetical protein NDU88_006509 [Pleurodeles waltl]